MRPQSAISGTARPAVRVSAISAPGVSRIFMLLVDESEDAEHDGEGGDDDDDRQSDD